MYADDIILICKDKRELMRGIRFIEEWSRENQLSINKRKSGVMIMNKRRSRMNEEGEIEGYPIVLSYKYLGTVIDNSQSIDHHLTQLNNKMNYLIRRITPFRLNAGPKFNCNLFKILVTPQYRLLGSLWEEMNKTERIATERSYRVRFKVFMMLPKSTSN